MLFLWEDEPDNNNGNKSWPASSLLSNIILFNGYNEHHIRGVAIMQYLRGVIPSICKYYLNRVNVVVLGGLAPFWHQAIFNHHNNVGWSVNVRCDSTNMSYGGVTGILLINLWSYPPRLQMNRKKTWTIKQLTIELTNEFMNLPASNEWISEMTILWMKGIVNAWINKWMDVYRIRFEQTDCNHR